ncbi:hypothetical protein FF38_02210 [Lucilia cuprina]|uniref:Uncharacterized protein n=1 Tax=Lucilia cuprina TaxID=7375 RepID=A0A0L0BW19_LUCCU|nr:hypothetical protein FF38_02210 [Lucilia cuprina]
MNKRPNKAEIKEKLKVSVSDKLPSWADIKSFFLSPDNLVSSSISFVAVDGGGGVGDDEIVANVADEDNNVVLAVVVFCLIANEDADDDDINVFNCCFLLFILKDLLILEFCLFFPFVFVLLLNVTLPTPQSISLCSTKSSSSSRSAVLMITLLAPPPPPPIPPPPPLLTRALCVVVVVLVFGNISHLPSIYFSKFGGTKDLARSTSSYEHWPLSKP